MAAALGDGEFWLPEEFLTSEDVLMDKENFNGNGLDSDPLSNICFPAEFPYEFGLYSTESESDEEDLSGLTRRFSRSTLQEARKISYPPSNLEKTWVSSGSPQSTLSTGGSRSVSSHGSPNDPSQAPSPPMTTPFIPIEDAWDLIYAAAGQVARMKMNLKSEIPTKNRGLLGSPRTHPPLHYSDQCLSHTLSQPNHFQQVRPEQVIRQHGCSIWGTQAKEGWFSQQQVSQNRVTRVGVESGRSLGLPQSTWPLQVQNQRHQNQQQQNIGSGRRAAFLGGSGGGVKRECAGTGVFIPRRYGNPSESLKKPGCSTALLPARGVQALNNNSNPMIISKAQAQPLPHFNGGLIPYYDALLVGGMHHWHNRGRSMPPEGSMNYVSLKNGLC